MARVPTWCNWWTFLPFRRLPFWRTWRSFSYLMMWILSLNMFIMMSEMPLRRSTCPANFITKSLTILSCISGASVEQGWKWIYINQTKKYQSLSLLSKLYQLIIWPIHYCISGSTLKFRNFWTISAPMTRKCFSSLIAPFILSIKVNLNKEHVSAIGTLMCRTQSQLLVSYTILFQSMSVFFFK